MARLLTESLRGHETRERTIFEPFGDIARNRMQAECFAKTEAIGFRGHGEYGLEGCNDARIKLALYGLRNPQSRHTARHRIAVWTIRRHCVVCIRYGDDARKYRDVVPAKPIGIPGAVNALVMAPHNLSDVAVVIDVAKDLLADCRVPFHLAAFV
jgi:hypothetical protein